MIGDDFGILCICALRYGDQNTYSLKLLINTVKPHLSAMQGTKKESFNNNILLYY